MHVCQENVIVIGTNTQLKNQLLLAERYIRLQSPDNVGWSIFYTLLLILELKTYYEKFSHY